MVGFLTGLVLIHLATTSQCLQTFSFNQRDYKPEDIIIRDVAIIGGGAAGSRAAVRLGDFCQTVVVIDQKGALGGHTETFHDPATGATLDIGVMLYQNISVVQDFFGRFDIPLAPFAPNILGMIKDFTTGDAINISFGDPTQALEIYASQLARFPTLNSGFDLPDPVPAELTMPFGVFAEQFNLGPAISIIWSLAQGYGDILSKPTLYIMKIFGLSVVESLATGFLTTAAHNNHELYERVQEFLGDDVLLNANVAVMDRDLPGPYAAMVVSTPSGFKLVLAKQFLFTIPPKVDNLHGFDLDSTEFGLFSQFQNSSYYTGLLRDAIIPNNASVSNFIANSEFFLPKLPAAYNFGPTDAVSGLTSLKYASNITMTTSQAQGNIIAEAQLVIPDSENATFAVFSSHTPFALEVSSEAIQSGFYKDLNGLQGRRRSFWSGAAFETHDSSLVWNFTDSIVESMLKA